MKKLPQSITAIIYIAIGIIIGGLVFMLVLAYSFEVLLNSIH